MIFSEISLVPSGREGRELAGLLRGSAYRQHQALWTLFPRPPGASRPFLFRWCEGPGPGLRFLTLSADAPQATGDWSVRSKSFDPVLRKDDAFAFELRINPTLNLIEPGPAPRGRGRRVDVVMHAIHASEDRPEVRAEALQKAIPDWFAQRATRWGFSVGSQGEAEDEFSFSATPCQVLHYERWTLRKGDQGIVLGVADLAGQLRITDPDRFRQSLYCGFGPGKAFGLGLMLLRRLRKP